MDALDAIRQRRAVRRYTDRPVDEATIDRLLRLALLAPTGHGAQAWSFVVVRDVDQRAALAELVLRGAARYFARFRPAAEGVSAPEHERWAADAPNRRWAPTARSRSGSAGLRCPAFAMRIRRWRWSSGSAIRPRWHLRSRTC